MKNPASCQISTSKFSYKPTYKNKCTLHHTNNPAKNAQYKPLHYHVSVKTYVHHSFSQENHLSCSSSKTNKKITTSSIIMSENITIQQGGYQSPNGFPEQSCRNHHPWIPRIKITKVTDRYLNCHECPEGPIFDNRPAKRFKTEKGRLFDLLPEDTLKIINYWLISFEYNYKHTAAMNCIIQKKNVLRNLLYTVLKPFHNFFLLRLYGTTKYERAHIF